MSDILNAAAPMPMINNNIMQPIRENLSSELSTIEIPDNVQIAKLYSDSEVVEQNNTDQQMSPEVFLEMLKDPNVTINYTKNIFALQDIIKAVSTNDSSLAEEFDQLFSELAVKPENLVGELINQENHSTLFKGQLFDMLRDLVRESPAPGTQISVTNLLKAINIENSKSEILKNISNALKQLSDMLPSNDNLSDKLNSLTKAFSLSDAEKDFTKLKKEAEGLVNYLSQNNDISNKGKLSNLCSMIKYNLSRFTNNKNAIDKSLKDVMKFIPKEEYKAELTQKLYEHLSGVENNQSEFKILDALVKIFQNKTNIENDLVTGSENFDDNIETILYSKNQNVQDVVDELEKVFNEFDTESENIVNELINNKNTYAEFGKKSEAIIENDLKNSTANQHRNVLDNKYKNTPGNELKNISENEYKNTAENEQTNISENEYKNAVKSEDTNIEKKEHKNAAANGQTNVPENKSKNEAVNEHKNTSANENKIESENNMKNELKNELLNSLKELLDKNSRSEIRPAITRLLTALNYESKKPEIVSKLSDSLRNISDSISSNKNLFNKLKNFDEKNIIDKASKDIMKFIPKEDEKIKFAKNLYGYISESRNMTMNSFTVNASDSKIFDALVKVLQNHVNGKGIIYETSEGNIEEDIFSLLMSHNKPAAEEIENIFEEINVKSENLTDEIIELKYDSSELKNEINKDLFDELTKLIKENHSSEAKEAVRSLLKFVITENSKPEILKEFSEEFTDLSKIIYSDKNLSEQLQTQENTNSLNEIIKDIMKFIPKEEHREAFLNKVYDCLENFKRENSDSKTLDTLVKILQKQSNNENIMQMKGKSVENVIHSLLSSPSNFTPLMHFVIPIDDGVFKAFGEMWVNPDEDDKKTKNDSESNSENNERIMHMLIAFDIPDTGHFETELWVKGKKINMSLFCPPVMEKYSSRLSADLKKSISFSEYRFEEIKVGKLEKKRSLGEVFPTLPQKRAGINVRI